MNILHGDCLDQLRLLEADSIDSMVTDPPAGISFMGKEWDSNKGGSKTWIAWMSSVMTECLRVMKPGAHGLVWAIPRTSHWTATACEDAGFEIRDIVTHIFGSGFPKSLNIEKAGAGEKWQGWGTALKPASEHWILVRKPISEKTIAANVLKHGTGGINIDASRIGTEPPAPRNAPKKIIRGGNFHASAQTEKEMSHYNPTQGRFPANLILDEEAAEMLDAQSGISKSTPNQRNNNPSKNIAMSGDNLGHISYGHSDSGGASRFFYCAKASKRERNEGCEGLPEKQIDIGDERPSGNSWERRGRAAAQPRSNIHPTVKPIRLMSYLITMITPPGGTVLDPFMGSGSTGVAAVESGFKFVGIEREKEYIQIAEKRIFHKLPEFKKQTTMDGIE